MEWLERHRGSLAALLVVLIAVAAFGVLQIPRRPALQVISASPPTPSPVKVHVTGAVLSPGVYQLAADARVDDALRAAGGPTDSAAMASLNLAAPLKDGQQVMIPQVNAAPTVAPSTGYQPVPTASISPTAVSPPDAPPSKLNLNTASRQELEALPGIGVVLAGRILEYRLAHNGFQSVDELKDAKLINSSTFEMVKGLVEVP